jgi:phosphonoacetate hydrolase
MQQPDRQLSRRHLLATTAASITSPGLLRAAGKPQRIVVLMVDGFGIDYLDRSEMPVLARWRRAGLYKSVRGVMPSVTNTNNASICCGAWPAQHGVTGNSYLDVRSGAEEYMESADLVLAPTLFERARRQGVRSALLTCKHKTATLLPRGTDLVLSAEKPSPDWQERLGPAPHIYSREINYWLLKAARDLLKSRPDLGCLYVHTTDYPMHTWAPEAPESKEHLARIDALLGEMAEAAPDAAFLLTADHGLNHKSRCWDLNKALKNRGAPVRMAISAERDKYLKHHRGFGGTSWIYLNRAGDADRVTKVLHELKGVETVLSRAEAVLRFHTMGSRIGDLVALGDATTVFGDLDSEMEDLPPEYRSHGSTYELDVPLVVYNAEATPAASYFQHNLDLARSLFPIGK